MPRLTGRPRLTSRRWLRWPALLLAVAVGTQCRTERKAQNCEITSVVTTPAQLEVAVGETSSEIAAAVADNGACGGQPPAVSWEISPAGLGQLTATTGTRTSVTGVARGNPRVRARAGGRESNFTDVSVYEKARIILEKTRLDFGPVQRGAPNPANQTVAVTGGGDRPLNQVNVTFQYGAPPPADWLAVSVSGNAAPLTITGRILRTDLPAATYTATITVASAVASNSPQTIAVSFVLTEPPRWNLTVTGTGTGTGTVTAPAADGQAAINCAINAGAASGQCTGSYLQATVLNLNQQATGGATFTGWGGACTGTGGCAVGNTTGAVNVSAGFAAPTALIGLNPTSLTFNATVGGANPASQSVSITNAGTGALTGLAVGTIAYGPGANGWLAQPNLSSPNAPSTLTVQPITGALAAGSYTATIPITSPVAGNSPQNVTVTFNVAAAMIQFSTNPLNGLAFAGGTGQLLSSVGVTSSSAPISGLQIGTITYGPGATNWIQNANLSNSATPTQLQVFINPSGLSAGTYTATVPVSGTGVATQNLTVSLTVLPVPGGTIVFARSTVGGFDNTHEVWRMNPNGANQVNLTNNAFPDGRPALSPGASQVAFRSDRTGNGELWLMAVDGSGPTQLTSTASIESYPAWVSSTIIAYTDAVSATVQNILFYLLGPCAPCPIGSVSNGATNAWPTASPTSPVIAFSTNVGTGSANLYEIWTYNWSVGGFTNLSGNTGLTEAHPAYSPNGQKIAFATNRGGGSLLQIWIMDANGANKTQITFGPGNNNFPTWSPDGTRIAFISNRTGTADIFIMNADGTQQVNVTNSGTVEERPSWR